MSRMRHGTRARSNGTATLVARVSDRLATRRATLPSQLARRFRIEATARGVVRIAPGRGIAASSRAARQHAERARAELAQYFAGHRTYFSVPLDLAGVGVLQARVLAEALRVGFGEVVTYTMLARRAGVPHAPRAVGNALATNPIPFIVPCHRVVRADGTWGHYAFGGWMKTALLGLERRPGFVGCTTTRIVCRFGCPAGRRMAAEHGVAFASLREARRAGYRACRRCIR